MIRATMLLISFVLLPSFAQTDVPVDPEEDVAFEQCEDNLDIRIGINPKLDTPFFRKREMHYEWWILRSDYGQLSSSMGEVTQEDRKRIEWTSNCFSTHQGDSKSKHRVERCDAELRGNELAICIWGGLPAYFAQYYLKIEGDRFTCAIDANYPTDFRTASIFRITKKQLHVKTRHPKVGQRYHAWLSIEFQEGIPKNGRIEWLPETHRIDGYLKPLVKTVPVRTP